MTYEVTFRKRFNSAGEGADRPETFVDVADGVILDARMSQRNDPPAKHAEEALSEDDDFESIGTEVWEYDIADGREEEFTTALENSQMVLQYIETDDVIE